MPLNTLDAAPSFPDYEQACADHIASVAANGGMHPTTIAAAEDMQRKRVVCMVELKIPRDIMDSAYE